MTVLIVDDEVLTRQGVALSLDWKELGIEKILQAEDGLQGLELARLYAPEIILSDVRMPRMDGIVMAEKVAEELPDTSIIFMSGYSDKEYLKAAIRLRAVHYIEKPLQASEIREAVLRARQTFNQKQHSRAGESLRSQEIGTQLARFLTEPWDVHQDEILARIRDLAFPEVQNAGVLCCMARFSPEEEISMPPAKETARLLTKAFPLMHLKCIYTPRRAQYLVFFLISDCPFLPEHTARVAGLLESCYKGCKEYLLSVGDSQSGLEKAYYSYNSAFLLLQNAWFFPSGSCLTAEKLNGGAVHSPAEKQDPLSLLKEYTCLAEPVFSGALQSKQTKSCLDFTEKIHRLFDRNLSLLPNQAVSFYYNLYRILFQTLQERPVSPGPLTDESRILDELQQCFCYEDVHRRFLDTLESVFSESESEDTESPVIRQIKAYIAENYSNAALSVKDIGENVSLSVSYVCTLFKNETGQTLNQYLTDYRMEKAQQLLQNPVYKIADISSQVGYRDGNYFGKSFRKHTGLSPSEYREQRS